MAERKVSFIIYYYMHTRAVQRFGTQRPILRTDLGAYYTNAFNFGSMIKHRILSDMETLNLLKPINSDYVQLRRFKLLDYVRPRIRNKQPTTLIA